MPAEALSLGQDIPQYKSIFAGFFCFSIVHLQDFFASQLFINIEIQI